jgi:hypothetical protein
VRKANKTVIMKLSAIRRKYRRSKTCTTIRSVEAVSLGFSFAANLLYDLCYIAEDANRTPNIWGGRSATGRYIRDLPL